MTSRESYFANIGRVQDCLLNSNFKFSELRNAGQLGYMISNETYDHKRLVIDFSLTGAALNVMGSNDFGKTLAWFNYDQELMEQIRINLNDDKRFAKKLMCLMEKQRLRSMSMKQNRIVRMEMVNTIIEDLILDRTLKKSQLILFKNYLMFLKTSLIIHHSLHFHLTID